MGLLSLGTPLPWDDVRPYADHVRKHGIIQFLSIWNKTKNKQKDVLLWGDEIEYLVISYDDKNKNARLSLRQADILKQLADEEKAFLTENNTGQPLPTFHPEFGRYMLESTPGVPYGSGIKDLLLVEPNMRLRRQIAKEHMKDCEVPITMTSYPRLGVSDVFLDPHHEPKGEASRSLFLPDELINPHVRFPTLAANIRRRRGSKVAINMPIYHDINTPRPFIDPTIPKDRGLFPEDKEAAAGAAKPDHIYMDAMGFGMGCCCLQITFQACNIVEARRLYDQLVPVGPIMLALTAAAPVYRGYLADVDCRWNVIAGSVDDRTEEERGLKPLKKDRFVIPKSRYDSVDAYISADPANRPEYNDTDLVIDKDIEKTLLDNGVDELLARHVAHLFIRDPLVVFTELLDQDDSISSDHFENLQSTNWQTMRFKPPPPGSNIGWRVEFRPMEIQLTDFENAAFAVFIVLLTRVILSFGLNFYIPISKVDENMKRAHKRGAVLNEKFYFRKNVFAKRGTHPHHLLNGLNLQDTTNGSGLRSPRSHSADADRTSPNHHYRRSGANTPTRSAESPQLDPVESEYAEYTIAELINGCSGFPGLIPLITSYLNTLAIDIETRCVLESYLDLVSKRADGRLQTAATFIREFIQTHPEYKHDSVVSQRVTYDLIKSVEKMDSGEFWPEKLLGRKPRPART